MRRTERLFQIIQILRATNGPVTGQSLATELEISPRTLYRDMAELIAQRVPVTGEAGTGYVLDDGYDMPPLMLTPDELEAAALGAAWVASQADPALSRAARDLVAKLSDSIPDELRPVIMDAGSRPIITHTKPIDQFDGAALRQSIRQRSKLQLSYKDGNDIASHRVIWPLFIAYLDNVRYIVAWREMRQDFRHFKTDRVQSLTTLTERYPARRAVLIKDWEEQMARKHGS